jgi:YidC/Oxa1 family membrane protein insertase
MDSDTRRMIVAMLVGLAVFVGYRFVYDALYPPPPLPEAMPAASQPAEVERPAARREPVTATSEAPVSAPVEPPLSTVPAAVFSVPAAADEGPILIGGREGDALKVELAARGAGVNRLWLYSQQEDGSFLFRSGPEEEQPYELLAADPRDEHDSFETHRVWIEEFDERSWRLDASAWALLERKEDGAVYEAVLRAADGSALLRFRKTYRLRVGKPVLDVELAVKNVSAGPLTVRVAQDGPAFVRKENLQYDMRRLLTAQAYEGGVKLGKGYQRPRLLEATREEEPVRLLDKEAGAFLWTALTNKYFGVYTRPLPQKGEVQRWVTAVEGRVVDAQAEDNAGDLLARLITEPEALPPSGEVVYPLEVYAGPKDAAYLKEVDPLFVDRAQLYYQVAQAADQRCMCTFHWLQELMTWLLTVIHSVVGNYGVAIIILVCIIRGLLHPLTVFQQKSMFRMQESMARIQPKMESLKEKYANDKVKLNQEMMKMWGEEGVNPMANFVSFLPLLLQMPILVALWTALNTDVHLRHAPFDGWWITDLSAPDAFFVFPEPGVTIPILSWLPGIGSWFRNIPTLNLLPILMGISMWLQQKYMPKPHMQAKLEAAKKQQAEGKKKKGGMTPEEQMRQQQIMMYMMSIMFPLMFYYWPSGLNLYWMATNVFGIGESLIIRRQLAHEKERRKVAGPPKPRPKEGPVSRFFKRIASQAEELQKKADELAKLEEAKKKVKKELKKKKR